MKGLIGGLLLSLVLCACGDMEDSLDAKADVAPFQWCYQQLDYEVLLKNNSDSFFILFQMEDLEGNIREGFLTPGGDQVVVHVCGEGLWRFNHPDTVEEYFSGESVPLNSDTKIRMMASLYNQPVRFLIWYEDFGGEVLLSPRWMGVDGAEFPIGEDQVTGIAFDQ